MTACYCLVAQSFGRLQKTEIQHQTNVNKRYNDQVIFNQVLNYDKMFPLLKVHSYQQNHYAVHLHKQGDIH